jgi:pyruvate formate lyase activating enzyme
MTSPLAPFPAAPDLAAALDRHTVPGTLWRAENGKVRCVACGHRCLLAEGRRGICLVRFNAGGVLQVPFGYVAGGIACDPVEKKPFFHVHPGTDALTFGMLGCDFHCGYCQNWMTSQTLREPSAGVPIVAAMPGQIAEAARRNEARLVVSSYNEPLITAEWAVAVFREAKALGLDCAFVSNGNVTPEALDLIAPWIVAYKIDLKGFDDRRYRKLGGTLAEVLAGIQRVHARGLWLELVTLVVPGFNDSEAELRDIAKYIASLSCDIPWHVTAFHPDFKMRDGTSTTARQLIRAAELGVEAGLRYVYVGNAPARVGEWENTRCPNCSTTVIARSGYAIRANRLRQGACPNCHTRLPGIWSHAAPVSREAQAWARLPRQVSLQ